MTSKMTRLSELWFETPKRRNDEGGGHIKSERIRPLSSSPAPAAGLHSRAVHEPPLQNFPLPVEFFREFVGISSTSGGFFS